MKSRLYKERSVISGGGSSGGEGERVPDCNRALNLLIDLYRKCGL